MTSAVEWRHAEGLPKFHSIWAAPMLFLALSVFRKCVLVSLLLAGWSLPAVAIDVTEGGDFIFDINNPKDMREVGRLSGITIKTDLPPRIGRMECARWARRYNVRPFAAVVSGTMPNRPTRVWICTGNADSRELSEAYCRQMKMKFVRHVGSVVTCRFKEEV